MPHPAKEAAMADLTHLPSAFTTSFSDGLRIAIPGGAWVFVSGQIGMPMQQADPKPDSFEAEVRICFARIAKTLSGFGVGLESVVNIKTYLTDLAPYAEFSHVRGELFPTRPPTSTAVQVAGLLFGARIEIDAVAFVADPAPAQ
jgi:enamine deaminase RidA (YjgF/YER057c/UK114 family)